MWVLFFFLFVNLVWARHLKESNNTNTTVESVNNPKVNDPKVNDPKVNDPKVNDPKVNDPKVNYTVCSRYLRYCNYTDECIPLGEKCLPPSPKLIANHYKINVYEIDL
jgi:hypothetical protein